MNNQANINQNLKHQHVQSFEKLASIIHMGNPFIQKPKQKLSDETVKSTLIDTMSKSFILKCLQKSPDIISTLKKE